MTEPGCTSGTNSRHRAFASAAATFAIAAVLALPSTAWGALQPLGQIGSPGSGAGQLNLPEEVAADRAAGSLYVADSLNARVSQFATSGGLLRKRGKARVGAKVTYVPDGGEPNTQRKSLNLKRKPNAG